MNYRWLDVRLLSRRPHIASAIGLKFRVSVLEQKILYEKIKIVCCRGFEVLASMCTFLSYPK